MCDFSLQAFKSRPAKVGDKLEVYAFPHGTTGFRDALDLEEVAVCVLPGTEIAFDSKILERKYLLGNKQYNSSVAIFRQVDKETKHVHHDALEFPDGQILKLTYLVPGQCATVLQMPAAPKTEQEAKDQQRLEVVG